MSRRSVGSGCLLVSAFLFLLQVVLTNANHGSLSKVVARRHLPPENALITAIDHLEREGNFAALADKSGKSVVLPNEDIALPGSAGLGGFSRSAITALGILFVLSAGFRLVTAEKRVDKDIDAATVVLLCGAYISIASANDVLVKMETQAHGGEMPFSPSRMVFMVEFMKLVITVPVVLVRHFYGNVYCPTMMECATAMRLMVIPAISYSVNNAIILMVVSHVDFSSLSVWRQLTPLFVALIWVVVFRRPLGNRRWLALLLLLLGTTINSYAEGAFMARWNPMLLAVLGSCCTTAVAGVANEYVVKNCVRLDLDFLCIFLYVQTTIFSFLLVVVGGGFPSFRWSSSETLLGGPPLLQEPAQLAIVGLQVLFGFAVARVIRYLGAVPRAIMNAMKELTVVIIAPVFVSSRITTTAVISAFVVGCAAAMFSTAAAPTKETDKAMRASLSSSWPGQAKGSV
mmetsp:Transcript_2316/g.3954  ORF Transcript_2316/g.3954 Transcript_2316/m.3954 type:complete len:458 (+) Transcript_2316:63-1436(+)